MMKLTTLRIKNLFGFLSYEIPLDKSEITILTGPNGFGKTIILKMISGILSNNLNIFFKFDFESILFVHTLGSIFITKADEKTLEIISHNNEKEEFKEDILRQRKKPEETAQDTLNDLIHGITASRKLKKEVPTPTELLNSFGCNNYSYFISAERLIKDHNNSNIIDVCAQNLKGILKSAINDSIRLSQELESTFPVRMFEQLANNKNFYSNSIEMRLMGLQDKKNLYMKYGLINSSENIMPDKDDIITGTNGHLSIISLYINDAMEKLKPFDEVYKKIKLFESIIKDKLLSFKEMTIDVKDGFSFKNINGDPLERVSLSLGEQNQIVILYKLIFGLEKHKVIIIDEPEISLHVAWQQTFLESLELIKKINNYDKLIIATHSPQIINKRWDLIYDLFEIHEVSLKNNYRDEDL